jgi:hypothetical protein
MRKLLLSAGIGLVSGVLCFFLSVAFLSILLLLIGAVTHHRPDMTLSYKVAIPVALFAAVCGFFITLFRSIRNALKNRGSE